MNKSGPLNFSSLPINECLPSLLESLKKNNRVILEAMPGIASRIPRTDWTRLLGTVNSPAEIKDSDVVPRIRG